jgi:hypothetical protein
LAFALSFEPPISFVDRSQKSVEIGSLVDRPGALERRPQQVEFPLREQADGYDALRHDNTPFP